MASFNISVDLSHLIRVGSAFTRDVFPHLALAVQSVADAAETRWKQFASGLTMPNGQVINPRVSEQTLALLELKQSVAWLADGLPFWVKLAHKWGDLPQARNDAGVVFTPRGSYVAVVLTAGGQPDESAMLIARASRVAYDALGSRPAS